MLCTTLNYCGRIVPGAIQPMVTLLAICHNKPSHMPESRELFEFLFLIKINIYKNQDFQIFKLKILITKINKTKNSRFSTFLDDNQAA